MGILWSKERKRDQNISEEIKFPHLKKETGNHVWESEVHNKMNNKRPIPTHIIIYMGKIRNRGS